MIISKKWLTELCLKFKKKLFFNLFLISFKKLIIFCFYWFFSKFLKDKKANIPKINSKIKKANPIAFNINSSIRLFK